MLADHDPGALSLRELARRLGVSHAAPYRHFSDKDALLVAIATDGFERLTAALEAAAAQREGAPLDRLVEIGWAYVHFALSHPQYFRVMFGKPLSGQVMLPASAAAGRRAFDVLLRAISAGQAAGEMEAGNVWELATAAWAQVHGLATLLLDHRLAASSDADAEAWVRRCTHILIAGIGRGPLR
jgi:AcrR family transcriptional regulator